MHVLVLMLWMLSCVLFGVDALLPRPVKLQSLGLLFFDLWIGLQFLIEVSDPVRF